MSRAHCTLALAGAVTLTSALPALSPSGLADDLAHDLMRRRADRTLSVDPADDRLKRLNTPGTSAVVPFNMTPRGSNADFGTSLSQWRSSLSTADQKKLEAAREASGEALPLPEPLKTPNPKLDVWAQGRHEAFGQGGAAKEGTALSTFMGADYRVDDDLLIGSMVQLDDARQEIDAAPDAAAGTAYLAGPYLAYRLTPHLQLDAKAGWGLGQDSAVAGDASAAAYSTERMLSEARLTGNWGWRGWQLSQTGAVTYLDETSTELGGAPGASVDITRLNMGPEIKRRFEAGEDTFIEPFAFLRSGVDLDGTGLAESDLSNTVGAGLTLSEPESYDIRATADYSESTNPADQSVAKGKVSVTVPTSILGF